MPQLQVSVRAAAPTPNFQFTSDGTPAGGQAVAAMQAVAEQDYQAARSIFALGDVPGLPFTVTVDPSAGGASHPTCAATDISLIPEDAPSLLVAETTECFMAASGKWDCGQTNGEGLSRALAMTIRPFTVLTGLDGDVAGWWNAGVPLDFVNDNSADDQDQQGNACGTLFIFYLRSELGYSWQEIVAAGGPTLGDTYATLTGRTGQEGFAGFVNTLKEADQGGQLQIPASGNPFPLGTVAPHVPAPPPPPGPTPEPGSEPSWFEYLEHRLFPHLDRHHEGWRDRA